MDKMYINYCDRALDHVKCNRDKLVELFDKYSTLAIKEP